MTNRNDTINPSPEWVSTENRDYGLTKREYFAAMAMQGLMAVQNKGETKSWGELLQRGAEISVQAADALIEQLNEQP